MKGGGSNFTARMSQKTSRPSFTVFSLHVACDRGLDPLGPALRCNVFQIFVDDVLFHIMAKITHQRVAPGTKFDVYVCPLVVVVVVFLFVMPKLLR